MFAKHPRIGQKRGAGKGQNHFAVRGPLKCSSSRLTREVLATTFGVHGRHETRSHVCPTCLPSLSHFALVRSNTYIDELRKCRMLSQEEELSGPEPRSCAAPRLPKSARGGVPKTAQCALSPRKISYHPRPEIEHVRGLASASLYIPCCARSCARFPLNRSRAKKPRRAHIWLEIRIFPQLHTSLVDSAQEEVFHTNGLD